MTIEVEKRGLLTQASYDTLFGKMRELGAEDLSENNTETIFYAAENSQLKVQVLSSKCQAKIAWKSGGFEGQSSRREIEVRIDFDDVEQAEHLMDELMAGARKVPTSQKRHDFVIGSVNIALKHSEHWGYHIELDEVVDQQTKVSDALERIEKLASNLNVTLLTPDEEKHFVAEMLAKL